MNITIIEDESIIREELKILLENALYEVIIIEDFQHIEEQILCGQTDLILLDLNLPGTSGLDICTRIRQQSDIPVIFLTSSTAPMDELNGMLKGGDDYITKPYQAPILLARIAAVLKRTKNRQPEKLQVRGVELDLAQASVTYEGQSADLTKNEWKTLHYLFQHKGQIVPRLDLVEYLWDNQIFIDDNALSVNITRIREKLKAIGIVDFIETKRGMGYRV